MDHDKKQKVQHKATSLILLFFVVMGIEPKACTHQASVLPLILRMTLNS
jgi:hypothetical protein